MIPDSQSSNYQQIAPNTSIQSNKEDEECLIPKRTIAFKAGLFVKLQNIVLAEETLYVANALVCLCAMSSCFPISTRERISVFSTNNKSLFLIHWRANVSTCLSSSLSSSESFYLTSSVYSLSLYFRFFTSPISA